MIILKYLLSSSRRVFWLALLISTSLLACAHPSWGLSGAEGERYFYFIRSNYLEMKKKDQAALQNMLTAARLDSQSYYLKLEAARLYARTGEVNKALNLAQEAVVMEPENPKAHLFIGRVAAESEREEEAISSFQKALELDSKNHEAMTRLGLLYRQAGEPEKAESTFKKLVTIDPSALSHYYLGSYYVSNKQNKEAIAAFKAALRKDAAFAPALKSLAQLYEDTDQRKLAEQTYRQLLEAQPEYSPAKVRLARLLLKRGQKTEAQKLLRQAIGADVSPGDNPVEIQTALYYLEFNEIEKALAELRGIIAASPANDRARYLLATILLELKDPKDKDRARGHLALISPRSEFYVDAQLLLASTIEANTKNDQLNDALANLSVAAKVRPEAPQLRVALALILEDLEQLEDARKVLVQAAADFPNEAEIFFRLGALEDRMGDVDKAIEAMKTAIEINSEHADALNYLAYTWALQQENLTEALVLAEKADRLKPNSNYIIDTLAWVHYQLGNTNKALTLLERAIELAAQDPEIYDHLGDVLATLGRNKEAIEAYQLALDHGFAKPEQINEKIKRLTD